MAFLIYRPVMRLFKCRSSSNIFWPLDDVESTNMSTAEKESEPTDSSGEVILELGPPWKPIV